MHLPSSYLFNRVAARDGNKVGRKGGPLLVFNMLYHRKQTDQLDTIS